MGTMVPALWMSQAPLGRQCPCKRLPAAPGNPDLGGEGSWIQGLPGARMRGCSLPALVQVPGKPPPRGITSPACCFTQSSLNPLPFQARVLDIWQGTFKISGAIRQLLGPLHLKNNSLHLIAGRNINNLRYADDTTLMADGPR